MSLQEKLVNIENKIRIACESSERKVEDVTLITVTKTLSVEETVYVRQQGLVHLGENRPEPFLKKVEVIGDSAKWHYIGSLQTRKVRDVINHVDYLHSLDRLSLASEIQKRANKKIKCFVQVKTSEEESKHGIAPEEVETFIKSLEQFDKIEVIGLMTMAPFTNDLNIIQKCFNKLKEIQLDIQKRRYTHAPCNELSMGMSNDYELAILAGATYVRIGTSLVGDLNVEG